MKKSLIESVVRVLKILRFFSNYLIDDKKLFSRLIDDTKESYWFNVKAKFYWLLKNKSFFGERHKKNLQTHWDGCHFSFSIHIFSLSRDAFAEKLFSLLLVFPSLCVSERIKWKNKITNMQRSNFIDFLCLVSLASHSLIVRCSLGTDCEESMILMMMTKKLFKEFPSSFFSRRQKNIS